MTTGKKLKQALKGEFVRAKPRITLTSAEVIFILREKNKLSQQKLAEMSGLSQSTISSIESGRIGLGIERAKVLAKALNTHPAVLAFPDWDSSNIAA